MQRPGQVLNSGTGHSRRTLGSRQCPAHSTAAPSIISLVGRPGDHRPMVVHTTAWDFQSYGQGQRINDLPVTP
jgi:hypothetical protein